MPQSVPARCALVLIFVAVGLPTHLFGAQPGDQARRGPQLPESVKAYRDLAYVENGHERQKLDLFVPESTEPLPVIIWVHGGGWQSGSKNNCLALRSGYLQQGCAVASLGYRLTDAAPFPAQIEDCKAGIRWLRAHAKQYGLDPDRFGAWGSSAGGHLVALLGTSGGVEEFDVGPNLDQSSRVQAVCDYYGPTDLVAFVTTPNYERHGREDSPETKLIGGLVTENREKAARAAPITYVSDDDPPFLIVHGDKDGTVPYNQSELLFEALKTAGVPVHFHTIHGAGHGGPSFVDAEVADMVRKFFEENLKTGAGKEKESKATTSESTASEPATNRGSARTGQPRVRIPWQRIASRQDTDHDGKISKDEFRGPAPLFGRLDKNGDGYVTREEHEAAFRP